MPLADVPVLVLLGLLGDWTVIQPSPSLSTPPLLAVVSSGLRAEPETAASEVFREALLAPGGAPMSTAVVLLSSGDASLLSMLS